MTIVCVFHILSKLYLAVKQMNDYWSSEENFGLDKIAVTKPKKNSLDFHLSLHFFVSSLQGLQPSQEKQDISSDLQSGCLSLDL